MSSRVRLEFINMYHVQFCPTCLWVLSIMRLARGRLSILHSSLSLATCTWCAPGLSLVPNHSLFSAFRSVSCILIGWLFVNYTAIGRNWNYWGLTFCVCRWSAVTCQTVTQSTSMMVTRRILCIKSTTQIRATTTQPHRPQLVLCGTMRNLLSIVVLLFAMPLVCFMSCFA